MAACSSTLAVHSSWRRLLIVLRSVKLEGSSLPRMTVPATPCRSIARAFEGPHWRPWQNLWTSLVTQADTQSNKSFLFAQDQALDSRISRRVVHRIPWQEQELSLHVVGKFVAWNLVNKTFAFAPHGGGPLMSGTFAETVSDSQISTIDSQTSYGASVALQSAMIRCELKTNYVIQALAQQDSFAA